MTLDPTVAPLQAPAPLSDIVPMTPERQAGLQARLWGLILATAVLAYCVSPLMAFADPSSLMAAGVVLAIAIGFFYESLQRAGRSRLVLEVPAWLLIGLGYAFALMAADEARDASEANDKRCVTIQHDMLASADHRSDDAAMMQALRCRPQGAEPASLKR